jgi:O-antigen ligase
MTTTVSATAVEEAARFDRSGFGRHLGALGFGLVLGILAASHGGYFATSWGWSTLVLAWGAVMALLLRNGISLSSAEVVLLAAACAFVAWLGLSILWSSARPETVDELERVLVYLCGLAALLLVVRRSSVAQLLAGTTVAIALVSAYALATRLFPDRVGTFDSIAGYRLSEPVGYWNALGALAAVGALLAVGFSARARRTWARAAAAASLPVLALTIEFTFSRGSWIALAVGLAAAVALDPRRLQLVAYLLALAPLSALAVWLASRSSALTTENSSLARAVSEGHRLALVLAALVLGSAAIAVGIAVLERRFVPGRRVRRAAAGALVAVVLAAGLGVVAAYGGPLSLARKAVHSFESPPVHGSQLSGRVFSLSSNGRIDLWRAAWRQFEAQPLLGGGAGTYEQYWRQHRSKPLDVRDAHSLYLETLAELGLVGFAFLAVVLAAPFAAVRSRGLPLVPAALGAYVAFLVHAGVDWDWEMPAVTLAGLACGAAVLVAARREGRCVAPRVRYASAALLVGVGVFAAMTLVGNRALDSGDSAAAAGNWSKAASEARTARTWLPWSSEPWRLLGDASFGEGDFATAARDYRHAISLDPRNWELWFDLGFATSGRDSDAAFARAAALDPRNPEIPKETGHAS